MGVIRKLLLLLSVVAVLDHCFCISPFVYRRKFTLDREDENLRDFIPNEEWFTQRLDHFRPSIHHNWQQRYYTNDTFFKRKNTPIVFLMIGGEGPISPDWMLKGQWIEYAKRFNALCFQVEHRFYGKSFPTKSMSTINLQYLTSQQALADLAYFIASKNIEYGFDKNVKWIMFGGSYPGSLAAWMRLKYPHLVYASVASSAPLLAKVNFAEYFDVVVESLNRYGGKKCTENIAAGYEQIRGLLASVKGRNIVKQDFKLCDSIQNATYWDFQGLYENLADNFAEVVQYNRDNRMGKGAALASVTIETLCNIMNDDTAGNEMDRLAAINTLILNKTNQECLDFKYEKAIAELRNDTIVKGKEYEGARQWLFQTCNEFGFFQTSDHVESIFSPMFPMEYFESLCVHTFGWKYSEKFFPHAVNRTNMMYGGTDIPTDRIIYVHGNVDPWHRLGVFRPKDLLINGTAHCADMYPSSDKDSQELKQARKVIGNLLERLINGKVD